MTEKHNLNLKKLFELVYQSNGARTFADIESVLESSGSSAIPELLELLANRNYYFRLWALMGLAKHFPSAGLIASRASLHDANVVVRLEAVESLGATGTRRDISWLLTALADEDWMIRSEAVSRLSQYATTRVTRAIIELLECDPVPVVRRDAALALARLQGRQCQDTLMEALVTESQSLARSGILIALYRTGSHNVFSGIMELLDDEDFAVRHFILSALAQTQIHTDDLDSLRPKLQIVATSDENEGVRSEAAETLEQLIAQLSRALQITN